MAIFTGELQAFISALVESMGGAAELPIVEASNTEPAKDAAPHDGDVGTDPLFEPACKVVRENNRASISLVQRHLHIGYNRAARLLERMEAEGLVSHMQPDGYRTVLAENDVGELAAAE